MASRSLLDMDPDEPLPEIQHHTQPEKPLMPASPGDEDFGDFQDGEGADEPGSPLSPRRLSAAASSTASYFSYPVKYAMSSALRRLSQDVVPRRRTDPDQGTHSHTPSSSSSYPNLQGLAQPASYTPPPRALTPIFQPPPLTPLSLSGYSSSTTPILSRLLAEEIRLLVPPRLQIINEWRLLFSLDQDGSSLHTLYDKCNDENSLNGSGPGGARARRGGCVVVVKDTSGDVRPFHPDFSSNIDLTTAQTFGAYLTDPPKPSNGHYYGHGECFLWRASILSAIPTLDSLPPPPSEDTTHATRMTTIGPASRLKPSFPPRLGSDSNAPSSRATSGTSTPERIRFKAFPYSGENDYLIFCEHGFLSVGGG